jgi:hypothetical protein
VLVLWHRVPFCGHRKTPLPISGNGGDYEGSLRTMPRSGRVFFGEATTNVSMEVHRGIEPRPDDYKTPVLPLN